jgi:HTH-type transcriptional regulator/antitoxin HigA
MAKKKTAVKPIINKIENKTQYNSLMKNIDGMMRKGENNLSANELSKLRLMAETAENYEDFHFPLPAPKNLSEMVELRMFQMKMNQTKAAKMLGIANSKFSQILRGRRKPDITFLKAAHKKLKIDAKFLLDKI